MSAARPFLYFAPVAVARNAAFAISTEPSKCGSRLVPIARTSTLISPVTLRMTSVTPSMSPRLMGLDLIATSIGWSGQIAIEQGQRRPCRPP